MIGHVTARARGWARRASLGAKLVAILAAVGLAGAAAITLFLALVITPSFNRLEREAIDGHVDRTRAALTEFASKVESAVRDYGDWNASYEYMIAPKPAFERESFSPLAMANLGVDGMAYLRADGSVVLARWHDLRTARDRADLRDALIAAARAAPLKRLLHAANSTSFYARLGDRVAVIAVAQIRRSDGSGAPRGVVVMARSLSSAKLSTLLQLRARLDLSAAPNLPAVESQPTRIRIAAPVPGVDGRPVARARFDLPREVSVLGRRMLLLAVAGSVLLLLMLLSVLRHMIVRLVLRPLHRVEQHMERVRTSGSLGLLEDVGARGDELAALGRSFNSMLRQLKDLREQLEVQSFALGRSESAVAVMHNVRNALNPVSTILSQGVALPAPIDQATIARAMAELGRADIPRARREKLVAFVAAAIDAEEVARETHRAQLQIGRDAMRQVLEIIGTQQAQAHERPPLEPCDVTGIIAQNATIARYSAAAAITVTLPDAPAWAFANRVLLSQVIGNLFGNAAEAIGARGPSGAIAVAVTVEEERLLIAIRDDGEGFSPDLTANLFQRGFSTRAHKSGGLGLHWCANSMTAMEGQLALTSEGRGQGATATLTLKLAAAPALARAA